MQNISPCPVQQLRFTEWPITKKYPLRCYYDLDKAFAHPFK